ncbi:MAG: amidohydrolase [candidate division Zixibacteria bacterium]|nr:amidohydrolase [candidate division Zixibacteria bacterium]NIR66368.1 amidohydrolase [candidate division Zixibacteria bacterium]NIS17989.1 amidohydrolase [candidate division Zixibacteria bacterium]NIS47970.1 amidohydrolase [candidate division Zixibacteria bacterium]NIT54272.1 amidohydrolase [candidate division Zixibacteria bacterium]
MEVKLDELLDLRKTLHRNAELSGKEEKTSALIKDYLNIYPPDNVIDGLGGYGLGAIYKSKSEGPTVLIRCDLDALPIPESIDLEYSSQADEVSHKCGHDGHMTIVSGLAQVLHNTRPERGRVVLLYQPGEEVGKGAQWVLDDEKFSQIAPDYVFALHNLPGFPLGQVIYREGTFASASKGLIVELMGETSHAAEPQKGKSPAMAVAQLINGFSAISQFHSALNDAAQVTVIHARVGERAFGTSPGYGTVMATLRSHSDEVMDRISAKCEDMVKGLSKSWNLKTKIQWDEIFPSTVNDSEMVKLIALIANDLGLDKFEQPIPFPWSEDFGNFTDRYKGALIGLGAGENQPALHHPTYDFPDDLIIIGVQLFEEIIRRLLSK